MPCSSRPCRRLHADVLTPAERPRAGAMPHAPGSTTVPTQPQTGQRHLLVVGRRFRCANALGPHLTRRSCRQGHRCRTSGLRSAHQTKFSRLTSLPDRHALDSCPVEVTCCAPALKHRTTNAQASPTPLLTACLGPVTFMGIGNVSTAGIPASPRHAGRRPPQRCAPGCPRPAPSVATDEQSSIPASGPPWSRTKPANRCGAANTASCPASRVLWAARRTAARRPLISSVRIGTFIGRLAHRGSGPSAPSTRAASPSASPWTLRPVRHGACGRRSSRQRPPRTRPH